MDFLILCGGRARRLGPLAEATPKVLMDVDGRPFLHHLLDFYGPRADRVILLAGHLGQKLAPYASAKVEVVVESTPLDTGGAVLAVLDRLSDRFAVANGDTLFVGLDLRQFLAAAEGAPATAAILRGQTAERGHIIVSGAKALRFQEKDGAGEGWVYAGLAVFDARALTGHPRGPSSLERVILPRLAEAGRLSVWPFHGALYDIGTPQGLEKFRELSSGETACARSPRTSTRGALPG